MESRAKMMTHSQKFAIEIRKGTPSIDSVVREVGPLPDNAVLFGVADDEKPVLFDIAPNGSGNTMVWDRIVGQGLRLIKTVIEYIMRYKRDRLHTEFVVLSNNTQEWLRLTDHELGVWSKNECIGIVPFWDIVADQVMFALSGWCAGGRGTKKPVLIFVDGFENVLKMGENFQGNLRAVLTLGRKHGVFVIASAKSESRQSLSRWLDFFYEEIYGQPQIEWFEMTENKNSVLFWTPEVSI